MSMCHTSQHARKTFYSKKRRLRCYMAKYFSTFPWQYFHVNFCLVKCAYAPVLRALGTRNMIYRRSSPVNTAGGREHVTP